MRDALRATLSGLEAGLSVRDIVTVRMRTCSPSRRAATVLARPEFHDFDQIPVRAGGLIVGVLERSASSEAHRDDSRVRELMRPLDDSILVEADLPLTRFLPLAVESPYYLVVIGARVRGLVTRSDLLKLPVRILAFAHVAHLEASMAALIRRTTRGDEWLALVADGGKRTIGLARKLARDRLDPDLLELTLFSEKRQVVAALIGANPAEVADLKSIEKMRNDVAHGSDYGRTNGELASFVNAIGSTDSWIRRLDSTSSRDTQAGEAL